MNERGDLKVGASIVEEMSNLSPQPIGQRNGTRSRLEILRPSSLGNASGQSLAHEDRNRNHRDVDYLKFPNHGPEIKVIEGVY
jgi:hypothetical protein